MLEFSQTCMAAGSEYFSVSLEQRRSKGKNWSHHGAAHRLQVAVGNERPHMAAGSGSTGLVLRWTAQGSLKPDERKSISGHLREVDASHPPTTSGE
jgi:hypothetical protein